MNNKIRFLNGIRTGVKHDTKTFYRLAYQKAKITLRKTYAENFSIHLFKDAFQNAAYRTIERLKLENYCTTDSQAFGLMMKATKDAYIDILRKNRRIKHIDNEDMYSILDREIDKHESRKELIDLVHAWKNQLSVTDLIFFDCYYINDLPLAKAQEISGIKSYGSAQQRALKLRNELKLYLKNLGYLVLFFITFKSIL